MYLTPCELYLYSFNVDMCSGVYLEPSYTIRFLHTVFLVSVGLRKIYF